MLLSKKMVLTSEYQIMLSNGWGKYDGFDYYLSSVKNQI
jgi:hypothetical protein